MLPRTTPMPLVAVREPFDHSDWLYEIKWDGFRALAYIDGHQCKLVSRRGEYKSRPYLATELAQAVRCDQAVLDGEIVCLQPDSRSHFYNLMFRREWPHFMAFDLLCRALLHACPFCGSQMLGRMEKPPPPVERRADWCRHRRRGVRSRVDRLRLSRRRLRDLGGPGGFVTSWLAPAAGGESVRLICAPLRS